MQTIRRSDMMMRGMRMAIRRPKGFRFFVFEMILFD